MTFLGHSAFALFDFGASHSFIFVEFVESATFETEMLGHELYVTTPLGTSVFVNRIIHSHELSILGCFLHAELIVMPILDFDIILGMDWLSVNHANIRCSEKVVEFVGLCGTRFRLLSTRGRTTLAVISVL